MTKPEVPPNNMDAERSVLGCQLLDASTIDKVREVLCVSDFYNDHHAKLQSAILKLHDSGFGVDSVTVARELESRGVLSEIGGVPFLMEILETVPHSGNVMYYAELVVECSRRRSAISIGRKLADSGRDMSIEAGELAEAAMSAAMKLSELLSKQKSRPKTLAEHVQIVAEKSRSGIASTVHMGIADIDQLIGGTAFGEMVIIGARPSMGKSMVAMQWLMEASAKGHPGLIISEEMSAESLATRALSSITCVERSDWQQESLRVEFDARGYFQSAAPIIVAEKCQTAAAAERAIATAVQSHGVKIVAVDYAQLLSGEGDSKEQRVADVSARMKAAAMRHDLVMLLLAQLNRGIEHRQDPEPQLADLRDSGGLEQDADVALFPFWPWKFNSKYEDRSEYQIFVRKNRNRGLPEHPYVVMTIQPERQRLIPRGAFDEWDQADR